MESLTINGKEWKVIENFQNKQILATNEMGVFAIAECVEEDGIIAVREGKFSCPVVVRSLREARKLFEMACETYSPGYGYMLRGNARLNIERKPQNRGIV
jgi:hypothetical protein